jgi:hypothetical protein
MGEVRFTPVTPRGTQFVRIVDVYYGTKWCRCLERDNGEVIINTGNTGRGGTGKIIYNFEGGFLSAQLKALELLGVKDE